MERSLRAWVGLGTLFAFAPACTLTNAGYDRRPDAGAALAAPCPPDPAGGCPVCSTPEAGGPRCHDRVYPAFRCDGDARCPGGTCQGGFCVLRDYDADGVDDDLERALADANLPALAPDANESCGTPQAIVYRVHRHPEAPRLFVITYVVLYSVDCGPFGHLGDDESFSITVDPDQDPGAPATVAVETDAHRGTTCESVSTCAAPAGTGACASSPLGGPPEVVIYLSKDKHSTYLDTQTCDSNCFGSCNVVAFAPRLPMLDVGQPTQPLTTDLTSAGLIEESDGWPPALLHFDPWTSNTFGAAGHVADQLVSIVAPPGP
jgi:hypothetical protein